MELKSNNAAVILAGGRGKRMHSNVPKQYMNLCGKPVLWYSLYAFQKFDGVDEIVLVCAPGEEEFCRHEFVEKYRFSKIQKITAGGKERYDSVYNGLCALDESCRYVFIHDGARPLIDQDSLKRSLASVREYHACVSGIPSKDTIKICREDGTVETTPDRSLVWIAQTPQTFDYRLIRHAYEEMYRLDLKEITDDASIVERTAGISVRMVRSSYYNIKVTTPEDILLAETFLESTGDANG